MMDDTKRISIIFLLSTFILTWIIWIFGALTNVQNQSLFITMGTFIPSIVGLVIVYVLSKPQFKALLKSAINVKIGLKNYAFIFLIIPFISVLTYLSMIILKFEVPDISYKLLEIPIVFVVIMFTMGPVGEEFGWRGFLLPRLRHKHSIFISSLIIGFIWSIWHIPLFFIEGALQYSFVELYGFMIAFSGYLFYTILLSLFITVIYDRSQGNLLTSILIHTIANLTIGVMPLVFNQTGALIYLSFMFIIIFTIYIYNRHDI